eukprot:11714092-Ditylum_brightwellii.AAC.1
MEKIPSGMTRLLPSSITAYALPILVAEKAQFLSPVQFGNRKGQTALDALLLRVVTMDCIRLFRLNGAILNNNLSACYDRMIPEVSSVHLQSLGLPDNTTKCSVLINKNMKQSIETTAGVTKDAYQHTAVFPLQGEGQGKTSSPLNWLFQSSTLLNALYALVSSIALYSVCKTFFSNRVAESYVDDTDCAYIDQKDQQNETPVRIRDRLCKIAKVWEWLIYGSDGELSRKKTYWWLIWWIWEGGNACIATKKDLPLDLMISIGKEDLPTAITRKDPTDSIAQLRLLNNLAAELEDGVIKKEKHSTQITNRLKHKSLSSKNAYHLYQNVWFPSM